VPRPRRGEEELVGLHQPGIGARSDPIRRGPTARAEGARFRGLARLLLLRLRVKKRWIRLRPIQRVDSSPPSLADAKPRAGPPCRSTRSRGDAPPTGPRGVGNPYGAVRFLVRRHELPALVPLFVSGGRRRFAERATTRAACEIAREPRYGSADLRSTRGRWPGEKRRRRLSHRAS
jgi:hypothetical protein